MLSLKFTKKKKKKKKIYKRLLPGLDWNTVLKEEEKNIKTIAKRFVFTQTHQVGDPLSYLKLKLCTLIEGIEI